MTRICSLNQYAYHHYEMPSRIQALIFFFILIQGSNMPFTQAITVPHPNLSLSANRFFIKCVRLCNFTQAGEFLQTSDIIPGVMVILPSLGKKFESCAQVRSAGMQKAECSNSKFHTLSFEQSDDRQEVMPEQDFSQVLFLMVAFPGNCFFVFH